MHGYWGWTDVHITCNRISVPLANGLIEQATPMCMRLCVDGSTRALVASQGTLSFPVMNSTVRPGIERFDGAQMVRSSVVTLAASEMILVGGTSCNL